MKANAKLGNKLEARTGQTVVPTSLKYGGKSC
jgi:hypothetical protein